MHPCVQQQDLQAVHTVSILIRLSTYIEDLCAKFSPSQNQTV